jgi:gas vesicle protein
MRDVEDVEPIPATSARPSVTAKAARAPRAPYTLLDGIKVVTGVISVVRTVAPFARMLRFSAPRSALALFGLSRRRGPLAKLAIFGVGLAVGIGAGLVLTPATGFDLRRMLVVGTKKKNKAKTSAPTPERKVASWVSERTVAIQDATDSKVDPLAETLRDTVKTAAKVGAPPPDHEHAAVAGTEVATPTRTPGAGVGGGYRFG